MKKKIYECDSVEATKDRKIIGGNPNSDLNLNNIKFKWAYSLYEQMLNNSWFIKEVNVSDDVQDYKELRPVEKNAYDKALAQLIFMDTLQTANLEANIGPYITAPEVHACMVRMTFEESMHSQSYAVLVDTISENTDEIYELYKTDTMLREKNDSIAKIYEDLANDVTEEKLLLAMFANQALEGIYFNSGFAFFYALARSGKMLGSGRMIKFINRDEDCHLILFQNMINAIRRDSPHLFTEELVAKASKILTDACELEIKWGKYITANGILGLNDDVITSYIQYLTNKRFIAVKMEPPYPVTENPLAWIEPMSKSNDTKTNFFESKPTDYSAAGLDFKDF